KPRILIVEDSPNDAALLKNQLEHQCVPADIRTVATCEEALKIIRGNTFELVFLDLAFPGMSGVRLLEDVGAETERIPFIAISGADAEGSALQQALNNGAKAVFR